MSYELYHHGIKGQKWGVRNGPPYPLRDGQKERTVLKKGTRLNSVSRVPDSEKYRNRGRWMYTYNPDDEWDSKVYKGPFSKMLSGQIDKHKTIGKDYVYEHQYETVKDLKMPTHKQRVDEFINLYKKYPLQMMRDLDSAVELFGLDSMTKSANLLEPKTANDYTVAYNVFNRAMEFSYAFKTTKAYSEIMSKKYDAMVDDNNKDVYNNVHDPIIIFRTNEALRKIGDVRIVSYNEMKNNYNKVKLDLSREGKRPLF